MGQQRSRLDGYERSLHIESSSGCEESSEAAQSPACSSTAAPTPGVKSWQTNSDSSSTSIGPSPRQLFVLVHGICGNAKDWDIWKQRLELCARPDWDVRTSTSITPGASFCGLEIQRLGGLLADEVTEWVKNLCDQGVEVVLHFVCHSLGGLVTRASLPQLCDALGGMCGVTYGHLLTLNTPHLGVRGANLLMCWKNMSFLIPKRISEQIHQLTLEDGFEVEPDQQDSQPEEFASAGSPSFSPCPCSRVGQSLRKRRHRLLENLADPNGKYCQALARFRHRTAVAASHWDVIVPFCTAAICATNPFRSPNVLKGDFHSFWKVDAAIGFEEGSPLGQCQQSSGDPAKELAQSLARAPGTTATDEAAAIDAASSSGDMPPLRRQTSLGSEANDDLWMRSSDSQVEFPVHMLDGLSLGPPWRRVAYTLHQPWYNGDVHLFTIGKDRKVLPWSIEFIDLLISIFQETGGTLESF